MDIDDEVNSTSLLLNSYYVVCTSSAANSDFKEIILEDVALVKIGDTVVRSTVSLCETTQEQLRNMDGLLYVLNRSTTFDSSVVASRVYIENQDICLHISDAASDGSLVLIFNCWNRLELWRSFANIIVKKLKHLYQLQICCRILLSLKIVRIGMENSSSENMDSLDHVDSLVEELKGISSLLVAKCDGDIEELLNSDLLVSCSQNLVSNSNYCNENEEGSEIHHSFLENSMLSQLEQSRTPELVSTSMSSVDSERSGGGKFWLIVEDYVPDDGPTATSSEDNTLKPFALDNICSEISALSSDVKSHNTSSVTSVDREFKHQNSNNDVMTIRLDSLPNENKIRSCSCIYLGSLTVFALGCLLLYRWSILSVPNISPANSNLNISSDIQVLSSHEANNGWPLATLPDTHWSRTLSIAHIQQCSYQLVQASYHALDQFAIVHWLFEMILELVGYWSS